MGNTYREQPCYGSSSTGNFDIDRARDRNCFCNYNFDGHKLHWNLNLDKCNLDYHNGHRDPLHEYLNYSSYPSYHNDRYQHFE
jgi:hypothetical protein